MKTFPTPAPAFLVRVIENKLTPKLPLHKIHLCPNQSHQSLAVQNNLVFALVYDFIEFV